MNQEYKTTEAQRRYMAKKRKDPEYRAKAKEYMKKWTEKNRDYKKKKDREYYNKTARRTVLRKRGITEEEYDRLLALQNGVCAICFGAPTGRWKTFAVDHNHVTNNIRGLLCSDCNLALGMFKDDVQRLGSAIEYLRK